MSFDVSAVAVVVIVIGGQRTLIGAVLGAAFYYIMRDQLSDVLSSHWQLALGLVFVLVVYLLPGGLVGGGAAAAREARAMTPVLELDGRRPPLRRAARRRRGDARGRGRLAPRADRAERRGEVDALPPDLRDGAGDRPAASASSASTSRGAAAYRRTRLGIGRTFQHSSLFDELTARENVAVAVQRKLGHARNARAPGDPLPRRRRALAASCSSSSAWPTSATRRPARCRTGTAASSRSALALATEPRLLLLDEPTAGMSRDEARQFMGLIGGLPQELTLMIVEHDMDVVFELATAVSVLDAGRLIASGPPEEIRDVGRRPGGVPRPGRPDGAAVHRMTTLLEIRGVRAGYDDAGDVLQGVDLDLHEGEVVALLGRNGVGKTTLMNTIVGLVRPRAGSIKLTGRELAGRGPHEIARAGIAIVPQGRRIFARLTVDENLKLARRATGGPAGASGRSTMSTTCSHG